MERSVVLPVLNFKHSAALKGWCGLLMMGKELCKWKNHRYFFSVSHTSTPHDVYLLVNTCKKHTHTHTHTYTHTHTHIHTHTDINTHRPYSTPLFMMPSIYASVTS